MAHPYNVFLKTMGRVQGLLLLHRQLHGTPGRPKQHVSDVLRGTLVLGVGALDSLVLDSVVAAIPRAVRDQELGPNIAKWVKDDPEGFLALLNEEEPGTKLAELCRQRLGQLTFQKSAMIEGVIGDVVRRDPPWSRAADILSSDGEAWDADAVVDRLDEIVERRHRIAHSGDLRPGKNSTQPIQRPYVEDAVRVIRAVGQAVDERLS